MGQTRGRTNKDAKEKKILKLAHSTLRAQVAWRLGRRRSSQVKYHDYSDAIMSVVASQITGVSIVSSIVLFRRKSKKTSKLRVTGLCEGKSPLTGEFPAQRTSNAGNVFIWWRHHDWAGSVLFVRHARGLSVWFYSCQTVLFLSDRTFSNTVKCSRSGDAFPNTTIRQGCLVLAVLMLHGDVAGPNVEHAVTISTYNNMSLTAATGPLSTTATHIVFQSLLCRCCHGKWSWVPKHCILSVAWQIYVWSVDESRWKWRAELLHRCQIHFVCKGGPKSPNISHWRCSW